MARLLGLSTAFCSAVLAHAGSRQKAIDFVVTASAKEVSACISRVAIDSAGMRLLTH